MQENKNIKTYNKVYGSMGERLACEFLENFGLKVIDKNYKNFLGEIDIICLDITNKNNPVYLFIEVKYRNSKKFGMPREAITPKKAQTIKKVATCYLKTKGLYEKVGMRFDCVEILDGENGNEAQINYLQNIF